MTAYLIFELDITRPELMSEYRQKVGAIVEAHGGRYLVRGASSQTVEGDWPGSRMAILAFPSREAALGFYESEAYAPLRGQRLAAGDCRAVLVDGVDAPPPAS